MTTEPNSRWRFVRPSFLTALVAGAVLLVLFKPLDNWSADYLDSGLKRALLSFAIARGLNGVISVAQGTEFAIQPAGVGINFSPGQILDPVNDLIERFSWIMLLSSSSLGMQKVLLTISSWSGLTLVFLLSSVLLIASLWWRKQSLENSRKIIAQAFIFFLFLRFALPVVAMLNEWVYQQFLLEQYNASSEQLENAHDEIGQINQQTDDVIKEMDESDGLIERARQLYHSALAQIDFENKLNRYKAAAEQVSENAISLIVVFMLQTVFFPLLFLWLTLRLFRRLLKLI